MSKRTKKIGGAIFALTILAFLVALDMWNARGRILGPSETAGVQNPPLQVEGLPILRPETITLGEGRPLVAIASSEDSELSEPAPLNATLTYEQVDGIVRRALDLDTSERSIRNVITPDDWVVIKVNTVTNPGNKRSAYYFNGVEHPGQATDLRVVKSVIHYLIEKVGPRRITIAEGGAESPRVGAPEAPRGMTEDGWSVHWPDFDNLSYVDMVADFNAMGTATVVDTCDLNDAPYRREPVPGGAIQRLGVTPVNYGPFQAHIPGTGRFRTEGFYMPEVILDCDKMISIAAMKTTIYGATLAIKNYVGTLASRAYGDGTSKREHYQGNAEHGYVDLFSYHPAEYAIIEGFWGTEGNGPQWGLNVQHNVVVVGGDPLAAEAVADAVMGFNPLDLEHLYLAAAKGFGTFDLRKIRVVGRRIEDVKRDFIKSKGGGGSGFYYGRGIRRWLVNGPHEGIDLDYPHIENEADLVPAEGNTSGGKVWEKVENLGYSMELVDLAKLYNRPASVSSYGFALIRSEGDQDGWLWLGYDGGAKVWLNGEVIFNQGKPELTFQLAAYKIPVTIREGINRLLIKVNNRVGAYGFAAHVVDEDGDRLPGIEYLLPGEVVTSIEEAERIPAPERFQLVGNYPNPFNAFTQIVFRLRDVSEVKVTVYDALGGRMRTLVEDVLPAGEYRVRWDGRDDEGFSVASGVYLYELQAGAFREAKQMTLMK